MVKSLPLAQNNIHTSNDLRASKRKILVVEDNELNREMLCAILEDEYELLQAENGAVGLELLSKYYNELSLVLLDVYMPICTGFEFLERKRTDALLTGIPVIVTTASNAPEDEVKCLQLGASDFVTKPYNNEVVIGRVHSIIKLSESVATLSAVEYDELTGLYTMPAFHHHTKAILSHANTLDYDMYVYDLQEFKLVNSVFGEKIGDEVLSYCGHCLAKMMPNAIIARSGDKFYILAAATQRQPLTELEKHLSDFLSMAPISNLVIKIGFYPNIDKNQEPSILCDRVILASSGIKHDFTRTSAVYDDKVQQKLLANQKMEADFEGAMERNEFVPWFQPKVNVKTERIVGAEALVRWVLPSGKMISPGAFIPLFEGDGLVMRLDEYIFQKVCTFQKQRIAAGKNVVPISVNLSRNSIYQKGTVERYVQIVETAGIPKSLVPIELTESAATEGKEIRNLADQLSRAGFFLHMDDFGTGYSSLSSLTTIPFDVIKLDKSLIDNIGSKKGETVIQHMTNIAQEMGMKVVAEGVEHKAQQEFLKSIGCDMIQGYYYSPPRDQRIFEEMLDRIEDSLIIDLDAEYKHININNKVEFELDDRSLAVLQKVADGMLEGFFIYRATSEESLLYANPAIIKMFGCDDIDDFRKLTGNSFRGIVIPEEYTNTEAEIFHQINSNSNDVDYVEYHFRKKDGSISYLHDFGHCVHTETYGNVFYVFVIEKEQKK